MNGWTDKYLVQNSSKCILDDYGQDKWKEKSFEDYGMEENRAMYQFLFRTYDKDQDARLKFSELILIPDSNIATLVKNNSPQNYLDHIIFAMRGLLDAIDISGHSIT